MAADKGGAVLLDALRLALAEPDEQPLFRSGKTGGLFTSRSADPVARQALQDGLLELVRTEVKGKQTLEWVRITPSGVNFLHARESPRAILQELQAVLESTQSGLPAWLESVRLDIHRLVGRLDALSRRVEEALRRMDGPAAALSNGAADAAPWAADAIGYLDRRAAVGTAGDCPLPELFAALRSTHPALSLSEFHDGVRRLADYKAIALKPFIGPAEMLHEPEYALLDGATVLYYATR